MGDIKEYSHLIEGKNLSHSYGAKMVYENFNFHVDEGRILGFLGKNGCGKSTTINILNGFLQPTHGEAHIFGENTQTLSNASKERIGFLIEGHIQYAFMTIRQIERFYSECYPRWTPVPFWELMGKLGVSYHQKISTMSRGQQSQVALGLILAQNPDVLILDDFSMGLDPGYRRLFIDYLRDYAKSEGKTILATSHIIQDMERLIDDVLIMDKQRVIVQKALPDFMSEIKGFSFHLSKPDVNMNKALPCVLNSEQRKNELMIYTYEERDKLCAVLKEEAIQYDRCDEISLTLEDAFIGLTGLY